MSNWIKKGIIFNDEWAQLPVVDDMGTHYEIYYSTRDENGYSLPKSFSLVKNSSDNRTFKCRLGGRYNLDGTLAQPILPLGKPGSFDSHGIMPSDIINLKDGTKYMYYVGWSKRIDVPYWNSTGLAISKDNGVTWEKYSEGPVFSTCAKEPGFIGTVCVTKNDIDGWKMDYSSAHWEEIDGELENIYNIKTATSKNGIDWDVDGRNSIELDEDEGGIAAFRKVKDKCYWSLRKKKDYRTNPKNSYKIWSYDISKEKLQLELEPSGDENMCAYPFVIEEKDKYIMFYNGHDFGKGGISYAELKK